jgi:hypothetical protein
LSRSHSPRLGDSGSIEVFCGVDVARETHHAVAVDRSGQRLADRPLPNDEAALRDLFAELTVHGRLLVVVDQPASIGALAMAVARSMGVEVDYLPGLAIATDRRPVSRGGQDRRPRRIRHRRRRPHFAGSSRSRVRVPR